MTELAQEEWNEQRLASDNAVLLDVRTEEEFNTKHIPEAKMLDIRQPQAFMDEAQNWIKIKPTLSIVVLEHVVHKHVKFWIIWE